MCQNRTRRKEDGGRNICISRIARERGEGDALERLAYVLFVSKLCHGVQFQWLHAGLHDEPLPIGAQLRISKLKPILLTRQQTLETPDHSYS